MKNKLNIVVVGVGYWGLNIIKTLNLIGIKNIYCYDNNLFTLKKIKKKYPYLNIIKDFKEILINKYFENIILSTPVKYNFTLLKKLLKSNKNIFVEKPVTKNFKQINELGLIIGKQKKIFMCGYIYLYNNLIIYIKKKIISKQLGEIKYIELTRRNYGPIRDDVSSLKDLGSHDLSICKFFFDGKINVISNIASNISKKNSKDKNISIFNIGKIRCVINSSWFNPIKERNILIIGNKKILMYDELDKISPIKFFKYKTSYPSHFKLKNAYVPRSKTLIEQAFIPKIKYESPLTNEIKHFIDCIKNKKKPFTNFIFAKEIMNDLDKLEKKSKKNLKY
jgi:predicted dehydrogenase